MKRQNYKDKLFSETNRITMAEGIRERPQLRKVWILESLPK